MKMKGRQIGALVLWLAFVIPVAGCASRRGRLDAASRSLADGKSAMLAGNATRARAALNASMRQEESAEAAYYLAAVDYHESRYDAALDAVNESIRLGPTPQALLLKGALLEGDDPDAAVGVYRMGLEHASGEGLTRACLKRNLGLLLARTGRWDEAFDCFGEYVTWTDANGRLLSDTELAVWGLLLYQRGRDGEARAAWSAVSDPALRERISQSARSLDLGVAQSR